MTPIQFVHEECANHEHGGSCLGVMINADLSLSGFGPRARCRVAACDRCPYFEECLAPMVTMVIEPHRAAAIQEAVAEYRRETMQGVEPVRLCPDCGAPRQPRKRYCPKCAHARQKATKRRSYHQARSAGMSTRQLSSKSEAKAQ